MRKKHVHRGGFSLIEVAMALAIAAFALATLLGLMAAGLTSSRAALPRTTAINLAAGICADLRQTPTAAEITASGATLTSTSNRYGIDVTQSSSTLYLDESGTVQNSAANATYKATISLTKPSSSQRMATYGTVNVSWPATAATPVGTISVFIALDRN
jgi:uncharacterized protein (TIGR02598 family)